jgi:hypothetical protein
VLLCRDGLVLGVDPTTGEERLDALWPLVRDGAGSAALLDELTRGGISAAPGFALFEEKAESWRILARGAVVVEIAGADESPIDGNGATAWVERDVPGTSTLRARPATASDKGPLRPIRVGVVVADGWQAGPEAVLAAVPVAEVVRPVAPGPPVESTKHIEPAEPVTEQTLLSQTISGSEPIEIVPEEGAEPHPAADDTGYDHLFGMTVIRKVEDAAVRDADEDPSAPPEDRTKVATGLAERRALRLAAKAVAAETDAAAGPRHWLELSTGGREELDGIVIVGRAPSATRVQAGNIPRLVTMTTPNQDISRNHAQVALEGDTVVVTDLHSSNGTFVVVPGRSPQKVRPGEPTPVVVDTVIDLGGGATLTVRVDA